VSIAPASRQIVAQQDVGDDHGAAVLFTDAQRGFVMMFEMQMTQEANGVRDVRMQRWNVVGDRSRKELEGPAALAQDPMGGPAIKIGLDEAKSGDNALGRGKTSLHA